MMRAMPLVNPIVTGYGMNLIAPPRRSSPNATRMKPASSVACVTQQALPSDSAVQAILAPRVSQESGIVVGLLDAGGKRVVAVGVAADRVFEIGSITKVFTASLLADMVARGEVKLDDPVAKFLPRSV